MPDEHKDASHIYGLICSASALCSSEVVWTMCYAPSYWFAQDVTVAMLVEGV